MLGVMAAVHASALETILWIVVLLMIFPLIVVGAWIRDRLKEAHPETFRQLGQPGLFFLTFAQNLQFLSFLFARRHAKLGDSRLSRVCDFMMLYVVAYNVLLVALFVVAANVASTSLHCTS